MAPEIFWKGDYNPKIDIFFVDCVSLETTQADPHMAPPQSPPSLGRCAEPALPMDVVGFDLTPQQRLALYEHVVQVRGKTQILPTFWREKSKWGSEN